MGNIGVRITGFLIFVLCLIGVIATILLSIAHNITDFSNLTIGHIAYIFTVIFAGLSIFIANCFISRIKTHYKNHYTKVLILRAGLLVFMVYNNYGFFLSEMSINTYVDKAMYLILCILLDYGIITLLSFSFDRMTLNFSKCQNSEGILKMYLYNKLFPHIKKIKAEYTANLDQNKDTKQESIYKQDTRLENISNFVQDKDVATVKNAILSYKDGNVCPSLSALSNLTGLTKNTIVAVKKQLEKQRLIETKGKTTYILEGAENV